MDRKAEARSLTAELVKQLKEQDDGEMYKNAQAFQAIQYLCDGKKDDAMRWLLSREPEEEPAFRVIDRYYYLVKIRVLLACGQPEGALPLIELVGGLLPGLPPDLQCHRGPHPQGPGPGGDG